MSNNCWVGYNNQQGLGAGRGGEGGRRAKTPVVQRGRMYPKEGSPLAGSYGQFSRELLGGGDRRQDRGSGPLDAATRERELLSRLDVLERENKTLQGLLRKSEKVMADAVKKAQEEENKIFNLFLGVINEKNIKIDLNDIEANLGQNPRTEQTSLKPVSGNREGGELETEEANGILTDSLALAASEQSNNLPYTLMALNRRRLISHGQ